jgi:HEPN domain-containing protein
MTVDELARSDFSRSAQRWLALELLMQPEAFPGVAREAQEIVELVLEGMLRAVGIDPPEWHDVGQTLLEHADKFPAGVRADLPDFGTGHRRIDRGR